MRTLRLPQQQVKAHRSRSQCSCPHYETTHARLLDEHGQVVATLKARGMELAELQLEVDQLRSDIARLKSEGALLANEKRNAERSCGTKDQEIEFLKSLIVSHSLLFRT